MGKIDAVTPGVGGQPVCKMATGPPVGAGGDTRGHPGVRDTHTHTRGCLASPQPELWQQSPVWAPSALRNGFFYYYYFELSFTFVFFFPRTQNRRLVGASVRDGGSAFEGGGCLVPHSRLRDPAVYKGRGFFGGGERKPALGLVV